jgi:hypothetical protein
MKHEKKLISLHLTWLMKIKHCVLSVLRVVYTSYCHISFSFECTTHHSSPRSCPRCNSCRCSQFRRPHHRGPFRQKEAPRQSCGVSRRSGAGGREPAGCHLRLLLVGRRRPIRRARQDVPQCWLRPRPQLGGRMHVLCRYEGNGNMCVSVFN